ncbi:MAG: cytochrome c [Paracoccaceae bacterium]
MRILVFICLILSVLPHQSNAQDKIIRLIIPEALETTGFPRYFLPRFSLKTAIRIKRVGENEAADLALNTQGQGAAVFQGPDVLWHLNVVNDTPDVQRFVTWLASDVGSRTITGFQPEGVALFARPTVEEPEEDAIAISGDAALGEKLSLTNCGRCHVINETNRMKAIGSTPSFALLRTFEDWDSRFQSFYVLKPHPSFTQVKDVTDPFDPARPSPIVPLKVTTDEIDAILAYVATIAPADLGAPLQNQ